MTQRRSKHLAYIHPQASVALCVSLLLAGGLLTSALAVVFVKHIHKHKVNELLNLTKERTELQKQWSQLLVEHSAANALDEIERTARVKLGMHVPSEKEIAVLQTSEY